MSPSGPSLSSFWRLRVFVYVLVSLFLVMQARLFFHHLSCLPDDTSQLQEAKAPLFRTIAPLFFPIDPETGYIHLNERITNVVFDVGVFASDYVTAMGSVKDASTALVLVDPHPVSMGPVIKQAAALNEEIGTRNLFWIPAALGATEGHVDFHWHLATYCSSMLPVTAEFTGPCAEDKAKMRVLVFTLRNILELFPPRITSFHIKVDTEGADLMVLKGAGESIRKFRTVIIECLRPNATSRREGECQLHEATQYMEGKGFASEWAPAFKVQANVFFRNQNITSSPLPPLLHSNVLQFKKWYGALP